MTRACVVLIVTAACAPVASAATLTVNTLNDDGPGSLRQAIVDAEPGDTIDFGVTGTILLTGGELTIEKSLTIEGPGVDDLSISGNDRSRVFGVYGFASPGVVVTISDLTIRDGNSGGNPGGSGILSWGGNIEPNTLELVRVSIRNNASGGIQNLFGTVIISECEISNNDRGGIGSNGTLTVRDSTISNNVGHRGGGIRIHGTASVTNTVISNNKAGLGGGIDNHGQLTMANSTMSGNEAFDVVGLATWGGGIASWDDVVFINCTIVGNTALEGGDGIYVKGGTFTLLNTIVADNGPHGDCHDVPGTLSSAGHNLGSDGTCNLTHATDVPDTDPQLGPLADYGGPTMTHALLPGSPAIDSGDAVACAAEPVNGVDQRGLMRPHGAGCDMGAFELGAIAVPDASNGALAALFVVLVAVLGVAILRSGADGWRSARGTHG